MCNASDIVSAVTGATDGIGKAYAEEVTYIFLIKNKQKKNILDI